MKKIYCIIGKSSSGKDTIAKAIFRNSEIKMMTPCTTRPMRAEESELDPYHFIENNQVDAEMIAKTVYKRIDGVFYYGFVNEELDKRYDYLAVTNPSQIHDIYKKYNDSFEIVVIYIETEEEERIIHAIEREESNDKNYEELCRRIKADAYDFSDNNDDFVDVFRCVDKVIHVYNDYNMTPDKIALELLNSLEMEEK